MSCIKCGSTDDSNSMLFCDSCNRNIHKKCSGLSASEIKVMELKGKRLLKFYCEDCMAGLLQVPKLLKLVDDLKSEVQTLKNNSFPVTNTIDEEMLNEINERNKRSTNIMFHNVPDQRDDYNDIKALITKALGECPAIVRHMRVGKKNKNGINSLKVVFSSPLDVMNILKNKFKLKGSNIYVSPDLTPKQRSYEKNIREELNRRKSHGEVNLQLRYIHGVPKIISKN